MYTASRHVLIEFSNSCYKSAHFTFAYEIITTFLLQATLINVNAHLIKLAVEKEI